jgi:endonuclease/exonuclease/phosphatase family metal-dependent hydrolase
MFYNTENFFDTKNDSLSSGDDDYTPSGKLHWTYKRFSQKRDNIAKTIQAVGNPCAPVLVGFCEVENENVLHELCLFSPLKALNYKYIHFDSPDRRGIDVALLYRNEYFKVLKAKPISINFPKDPDLKTRDLLLVEGVMDQTDTLYVMVCHWPSKRGGEEASENRREFVASVCRNVFDSILAVHKNANLLLMGDLNDESHTSAIEHFLGAGDASQTEKNLVDMACNLHGAEGSHKYQGVWSCIDHIIVSRNMMSKTSAIQLVSKSQQIFALPFLLDDDPTWMGQKPHRTFNGPSYAGGTSDHLPVAVDVMLIH